MSTGHWDIASAIQTGNFQFYFMFHLLKLKQVLRVSGLCIRHRRPELKYGILYTQTAPGTKL